MLKIGDKIKIKVPRHDQSFYNGITGTISNLLLDPNIAHVNIDRCFLLFVMKIECPESQQSI